MCEFCACVVVIEISYGSKFAHYMHPITILLDIMPSKSVAQNWTVWELVILELFGSY